MAAPTASDLATLMGTEVDSGQATAVIGIVTAMASAYTRGLGFTAGEPDSDVRAVILTASARLLRNPSALAAESMGPFAITHGPEFGWTTAELSVLNRYRVRAQ